MKADEISSLISALTDRQPLPLPPESSEAAVVELHELLLDLRNFMMSLVQGDLSQDLSHKGYLAGALKSLQANLRHLTWQTERISHGDFTQRIDFMGDFAVSFNSMTQQLKEAREQLEAANRVLQIRADTDGLTGLNNHAFLMKTLEAEIARSRRYGTALSIVMLDVDHFRKFNDTYGHQVGDAVLKKASALMRQPLRDSDTAGRYGGEEFMLILPNTDLSGARSLAERVRSLIEATPFTESGLKVTISAGIATWEKQQLFDLIQAADDRLYDAKHNGRNRVAG
jgi:two-component system, cell cycle response regulator